MVCLAEAGDFGRRRQLSHVYSDGRQLWATNGYVLHALDVATEKSGRVTLNE
jgi:hypothetical protein